MSKRKKIWIGCGAAVALGLSIFIGIRVTRKEEVPVQTAKVERKEVLKAKVSASGEIRAKEFVDLQSEIAGLITELPVHEGDKVQKGDVLLRIDPIQTEAETQSSRAQHEGAVADARGQEFQIMNAEADLAVKSAKAQLEVARAKVAQMETQIQVSKNNIQQMKSSYAAAASRVRSMAANLTRASDQLKKTTLYSPLTGVITQLLVEKGERAVPGIMSNPQATLMTIADLSVIQAELKVDETDVVNLALGNKAQIKVDALPDMVFEGEVTEIGNSPIKTAATGQQQQEAKDFKVIVTLTSPSRKLRPGMSCTGDMITETKQNVLVVPIQALTIREVPVDKDGRYHEPDLKKNDKSGSVARADSSPKEKKAAKKELQGVFVINKERLARFRTVKTGITGDSEIEVLENLAEGEEVVSGSFQTLRTIKDGALVKIDNSGKNQADKKK